MFGTDKKYGIITYAVCILVSVLLAGCAGKEEVPVTGCSEMAVPSTECAEVTVSGQDDADVIEEDVNMMRPAGNYVEHQVICMADSKEEAEKIAARVGGRLSSFSYGVGTIAIDETVEELMKRLSKMKNPPEVYPNHIVQLDDPKMERPSGMEIELKVE